METGDLNSVENCDRILDFSTSAQEDTRFVKLLGTEVFRTSLLG